MLVTKLKIDGQYFYLVPETDVDALKSAIVAAVKSGSAFVEFETHGHGRVSVLMTPYIPARFEIVERTEEEVAGWADEPPSFEYDPDSFLT